MSAEPFTRISVIIPVYNEEENVAELHGRIITALSRCRTSGKYFMSTTVRVIAVLID